MIMGNSIRLKWVNMVNNNIGCGMQKHDVRHILSVFDVHVLVYMYSFTWLLNNNTTIDTSAVVCRNMMTVSF